uniref:Uncharacterized protein n=1 Tax=Pseudomonas phage RVTF4 TaxID=3236931 RepID=A0AB39CD99_9VIRU
MIRRIMISLDALLDTRLGVISNIDSDAAKHLVSSLTYWERNYDDWYKLTGGRVPNEVFQKAWAERGGENTRRTLDACFESGLSPFIYQCLAEADINMMSGMTPIEEEIGLAINIYPYDLSFQEKQELINIMQLKYGTELPVMVVSHSLEEMSPELLSSGYGMLVLYDFAEWFKIHHVAIVATLMSDFVVVHPKLFDRDPSELSLEQQKHEFLMFRLATQHNMDINYIDAGYFSLVNPRFSSNPEPLVRDVKEEEAAYDYIRLGDIKATP